VVVARLKQAPHRAPPAGGRRPEPPRPADRSGTGRRPQGHRAPAPPTGGPGRGRSLCTPRTEAAAGAREWAGSARAGASRMPAARRSKRNWAGCRQQGNSFIFHFFLIVLNKKYILILSVPQDWGTPSCCVEARAL